MAAAATEGCAPMVKPESIAGVPIAQDGGYRNRNASSCRENDARDIFEPM